MKRRMIPLLLVAAALAACSSPRVSYGMAEKAWAIGLDTAIVLRKADKIDRATWEKLDVAIQAGDAAFENWLQEILKTPDGEKPSIPNVVIQSALDSLDILQVFMLKRGD